MPCNIDNDPCIAARGISVCFKPNQLTEDAPDSWLGTGTVLGLKKDHELTKMNRKNIIVYRILVDFGDNEPASVLPCTLKRC